MANIIIVFGSEDKYEPVLARRLIDTRVMTPAQCQARWERYHLSFLERIYSSLTMSLLEVDESTGEVTLLQKFTGEHPPAERRVVNPQAAPKKKVSTETIQGQPIPFFGPTTSVIVDDVADMLASTNPTPQPDTHW